MGLFRKKTPEELLKKAIIKAVEKNEAAKLQLLLINNPKFDINEHDLLKIAITEENENVIKTLIKNGADTNIQFKTNEEIGYKAKLSVLEHVIRLGFTNIEEIIQKNKLSDLQKSTKKIYKDSLKLSDKGFMFCSSSYRTTPLLDLFNKITKNNLDSAELIKKQGDKIERLESELKALKNEVNELKKPKHQKLNKKRHL